MGPRALREVLRPGRALRQVAHGLEGRRREQLPDGPRDRGRGPGFGALRAHLPGGRPRAHRRARDHDRRRPRHPDVRQGPGAGPDHRLQEDPGERRHAEGSLLKPAMVVSGVDAADKSDPTEIAQLTVRTLERCVPGAMPGVTFLSGGISEEDASIYLNEINKVPRKTQTRLTFSYSRALQSSCIKTWKGEAGNVDAAQKQLLARPRPTARPPRASTSRARSRPTRSRSS